MRAPADLRAQILQGLAVSARPSLGRRPFALAAAALAAAASIALVIYTALPTSRATVVPFEIMVTAAVRETVQPPRLEFSSDSATAIRSWLQDPEAPVPEALPGRLIELPPVGSSVTEWQGVRCSLVSMRAPELEAAALEPIVAELVEVVERALVDGTRDVDSLQHLVRRTVGKWVDREYRRRPMLVPTVIEV